MSGTGPASPLGSTWVSASAIRKIRSVGMFVGLVTVLWSLICAGLILGLGSDLPTSHNPINGLVVAMGLCSTFLLFVLGSGLMVARRNVSGESLDVRGSRSTVRILLVLWGGTIFAAGLSGLLLVLLITKSGGSSSRPELHFSPAVIEFLSLPVSAAVVAGVGFFVARNLLRTSPPP